MEVVGVHTEEGQALLQEKSLGESMANEEDNEKSPILSVA